MSDDNKQKQAGEDEDKIQHLKSSENDDKQESKEVSVEVKPYVVNGKPDLIIETIVDQQDGDTTIISTTLVNQGSNGAEGFWLDIFVGSLEPDFHDIGDVFIWVDYLGPNRGLTVQSELSIQGTTTVWGLVDTTKLIEESHENNNKESITVTVTQND